MKKNTIKVIAYSFIISFMVFVASLKVYALTENELKNKKSEIEQKIENTNTEIAGIKTKMTTNLEQINRLNVQIKEYEDSLQDTDEKLNELNEALEESKIELEKAKDEYNFQKGLIEKRLIAIYESSKTTYLDILLGSNSLSDFFNKYYVLEELTEYDNKLLKSLDIYETAVSIKTNLSKNKKDEVQNMKETIQAKTGAMEILVSDKDNLISNLSKEEIELNKQLEQFELDKKDIEKQLVDLAKQNSVEKALFPSKSGYISPLIGRTKANITTGYNGYAGHTGVDFAIPLGNDVVAVKSGTVVISEARKNANGTYRSYGEYVVVDHHDGTMTLYAHGSPNSRVVEVNDVVEQRSITYEIRNNRKFNRTTFTF